MHEDDLVAQSVEILFDAATEAAVRREWDALAAAGVPSQALHTAPSNRPHVTLATVAAIQDDVEHLLVGAAAGLPLPVRLGGVAVLGAPGRRVLARLVIPTARLLALHGSVLAALNRSAGVSDVSRPGRWTPHVTLARRVPDRLLEPAVAVLNPIGDLAGEGVTLRRWDGDARREWTLPAG